MCFYTMYVWENKKIFCTQSRLHLICVCQHRGLFRITFFTFSKRHRRCPALCAESVFQSVLITACYSLAGSSHTEAKTPVNSAVWFGRVLCSVQSGAMCIRVEWFSLFCDFRKRAHCYRLAIFLWVQFQKIGEFSFSKITGTLKINIFFF